MYNFRNRTFMVLVMLFGIVLMAMPSFASARTIAPDLKVTGLTAPAKVVRGTRFDTKVVVRNFGREAARSSETAFYLSKDKTRSRSDRFLGRASHPALRGNYRGVNARIVKLGVLKTVSPGKYYLIACADNRNNVREYYEKNNCRTSKNQIQVINALKVPRIVNINPSSPSAEINPRLTIRAQKNYTIAVILAQHCNSSNPRVIAKGFVGKSGRRVITLRVAKNKTTKLAVITQRGGINSRCSNRVSYINAPEKKTEAPVEQTPVKDETAPAVPVLAPFSLNTHSQSLSPTVFGQAEAGSIVRVYTTNTCSGNPIASATANAVGLFVTPVPMPANQTTKIYLTATDTSGNVSACSLVGEYLHDDIAPDVPSNLIMTPEGPANDNLPVISLNADADTRIELYQAADCFGEPLGVFFISDTGMFSTTVGVTDSTTATFSARSIDKAGNVSACSENVSYTEDSTPPEVLAFNTDNWAAVANDNSPELEFNNLEIGSTVRAYLNNDCSGPANATMIVSNLNDKLTLTIADDTVQQITATATDSVGNTSLCSNPMSYTEDSTAPNVATGLTTYSPDSGLYPSVYGSAEAGNLVVLYLNGCNGELLGVGFVNSDGSFFVRREQWQGTIVKNATNTLSVVVVDEAGNMNCADAPSVDYTHDDTAPTSPTISNVSPQSPNQSAFVTLTIATPEAANNVYLYLNDACTGTPVSHMTVWGGSSPYAFIFTAPDNATTTVSVAFTDKAGNRSACSGSIAYTHDNMKPEPTGLVEWTTPTPSATNTSVSYEGKAALMDGGETIQGFKNADCSGTRDSYTISANEGVWYMSFTMSENTTTAVSFNVIDDAGNKSTCVRGNDYTHDNQSSKPVITTVVDGDAATPDKPTFKGTADNGDSVSLYDHYACNQSSLIATSTADADGFVITTANLPRGVTRNYSVKASDALGNTSACSEIYQYATPIAHVEITSASPASPSNATTLTISGTGDSHPSIGVYIFMSETPTVYCASGSFVTDVDVDDAGNFSAENIAVEANKAVYYYAMQHNTSASGGFAGQCSNALEYTHDGIAPTVNITAPTTETTRYQAGSTVILSGNTSDDNRVTSVVWENAGNDTSGEAIGTNSWQTAAIGLIVGENVITITATDIAGNTSTDTLTVYRDNTTPALSITSPTDDISYVTSAETIKLGGTAADASGLSLITWKSFEGESSGSVNGTSNWETTDIALVDGRNYITIEAIDNAGNGRTEGLVIYRDNTDPIIEILTPSTESSFTTSNSSLDFTGSSFDTNLISKIMWVNSATSETGNIYPGTSWYLPFMALSSGENTITFTATDYAGNTGSDTIVVTRDNTPPETTFTDTEPSPTNDTTADFAFTSNEDNSTFVCQVNDGDWESCTSPYSTTALIDRVHTFQVQAIDAVGNADPSPASYTFVIDTQAPNTSFIETPSSPTNDATADFAFASDEPNSTFQCKTDGGAFAACTSPHSTTSLEDGFNGFEVRAIDAAGNTDPTAVRHNFIVDTSLPNLAITSPTVLVTSENLATLSGTSSDNLGMASITWANSNTDQAGIVSGFDNWTAADIELGEGLNAITVTATDTAGNTRTRTIDILRDTTRPTVSITHDPSANSPTNLSPVVFHITFSEPVTGFNTTAINDNITCGGSGQTSGGGMSYTYAFTPGSDLCTVVIDIFEGKVSDAAGNTNTASETETVVFDNRAPALEFSSPTTGAAYETTDSIVAISGTASDTTGIASVTWLNTTHGTYGNAMGDTNWSFNIGLGMGVNLIDVIAYDGAGNKTTKTISMTRSALPIAAKLVVEDNGIVLYRSGPTTDTIRVKLNRAPSGSVTVTPSVYAAYAGGPESDVSASGPLIFTTSNWDTYQTVTLSIPSTFECGGGGGYMGGTTAVTLTASGADFGGVSSAHPYTASNGTATCDMNNF